MTDQQEPQGDQGGEQEQSGSPVSGTVKIALFVVFAIIAIVVVLMTQSHGAN